MDDYLENLTEAIQIEGSAELMAELREARAASKKAAGADDALKVRLSPVAESVAAIAPLASICNPLRPCAVAVNQFHGYAPPAQAERKEIKIPVYDWQAAIERHRDHVRAEATETARLSEIARLKARDDYETSKRPAPQASPEPVQAAPAMKRRALIAEYLNEWPSIEADLNDASRNELDSAKLPKHGMWDADKALAWARSRGKLVQQRTSMEPAMWHGPITRHQLR